MAGTRLGVWEVQPDRATLSGDRLLPLAAYCVAQPVDGHFDLLTSPAGSIGLVVEDSGNGRC
jgi:hypothetical protein